MDTTGWDPSLQRGYKPECKALVLRREVLHARNGRQLEYSAIGSAIFALVYSIALLCSGCTPTQRKATLAVTSTTLLAVDWRQSRGYVEHKLEENPLLNAGFPVDVYFPVVIAANLVLGYYVGEGFLGVTTGIEGHAVVRNALLP